jgi:hypothetical protein
MLAVQLAAALDGPVLLYLSSGKLTDADEVEQRIGQSWQDPAELVRRPWRGALTDPGRPAIMMARSHIRRHEPPRARTRRRTACQGNSGRAEVKAPALMAASAASRPAKAPRTPLPAALLTSPEITRRPVAPSQWARLSSTRRSAGR